MNTKFQSQPKSAPSSAEGFEKNYVYVTSLVPNGPEAVRIYAHIIIVVSFTPI